MRAGASQRLDKGLETVADGAQVKGHTPSRIDRGLRLYRCESLDARPRLRPAQ